MFLNPPPPTKKRGGKHKNCPYISTKAGSIKFKDSKRFLNGIFLILTVTNKDYRGSTYKNPKKTFI